MNDEMKYLEKVFQEEKSSHGVQLVLDSGVVLGLVVSFGRRLPHAPPPPPLPAVT